MYSNNDEMGVRNGHICDRRDHLCGIDLASMVMAEPGLEKVSHHMIPRLLMGEWSATESGSGVDTSISRILNELFERRQMTRNWGAC